MTEKDRPLGEGYNPLLHTKHLVKSQIYEQSKYKSRQSPWKKQKHTQKHCVILTTQKTKETRNSKNHRFRRNFSKINLKNGVIIKSQRHTQQF